MPKVKYKHMLRDEAELWDRFLETSEIDYLDLLYDVHVGTLPDLPEDTSPEMERLAEAIYRKRIDVVMETVDEVWIIEVKPRAGMSALGQLLTYSELYEREFSPDKDLHLAVVCERLEQDAEDLLTLHGVDIFVV